jgi:hypothetical protein
LNMVMNFWVPQNEEIPWPAEELSASQQGLCTQSQLFLLPTLLIVLISCKYWLLIQTVLRTHYSSYFKTAILYMPSKPKPYLQCWKYFNVKLKQKMTKLGQESRDYTKAFFMPQLRS